MKKSSRILYDVLYFGFINPLICKRNNVVVNAEEINDLKPPFVAICNHPGFFDWAYAAKALRPHYVSFMTAKYYFYNRYAGFLLRHLNAIPKQLFAADVQTVRNSLHLIKNGDILCFFPEGRLSAYGELETIADNTYALLMLLNVPVVNIHIDGSYRSTPKYNNRLKKGRIDVKASILFQQSDFKNIDKATGQKLVYNALYYNEFSDDVIREFKSKNIAEGLENILYMCPKCKKEFTMKTKRNRMLCMECGNSITLDDHYRFHADNGSICPDNIRAWYLFQKEVEKNRIVESNDFEIKGHVVLKQPLGKIEMFTKVGEGTAIANKDGFTYIGTKQEEDFKLHVPLNILRGLLFGANQDFEVYHGNEIYYFEPDDKRHSVKWAVVYEQIYLLYKNSISN